MNNNIKNILAGLFAVLVVCLFAFAVINMTKENSAKQMEALEEIKTNAEKEAITANKKRDSVIRQNSQLSQQVGGLETRMIIFDKNILGLSSKFDKSFNEIKNYQNEKDHVIDASVSEQSDFISKYKYKEY
ncbi:MAG: hypothetical protein RSE50_00890 [Myroides sp.]